jgi:hypothetical protein
VPLERQVADAVLLSKTTNSKSSTMPRKDGSP